MTDSFFNGRNIYDEQTANWTAGNCEALIDAAVRRMVKLEGPIQTARRVQRIADICAGAYVLPIEHWKSLPAKKEHERKRPTAPKRFLERMFVSPVVWFSIGWWLSIFVGGRF